jgi:hypothetical protein
MNTQRSVNITHWISGENVASVTVWPFGEGRDRHPELAERMTVALYTGACNVSLKPTAAEARALIEALQWALQAAEVPA